MDQNPCPLHAPHLLGAQAGLYYHYQIPKYDLGKSSSASSPIGWCAPSHRCSGDLTISSTSPLPLYREPLEDIQRVPELELLAISEQAGVFAVKSSDNRRFFITGHPEYDPDTLANEYFRDVNKGLDIAVPENYFAQDDPSRPCRPLAFRRPAFLYQLAQLLRLPNHSLRLEKKISD